MRVLNKMQTLFGSITYIQWLQEDLIP